MSEDPDRVSLAFIWDTDSPRFSRRTFMRTMAFASAAGFLAACGGSSSKSELGVEHAGDRRRRAPRPRRSTSTTGPTTSPTTRSRTSRSRPGSRSRTTTTARTTSCSPRCSAGSTGYDIIVPTDATLVKMKHADLLEPLDLSLDPERQEPRPALPQRRVRPGQPVLDPVAVGHDRHRLRQDEGRRRGHRLGRVQPARGQGQELVPRRGARRVRDGAVRAGEGSQHARTTTISTPPRTTSST